MFCLWEFLILHDGEHTQTENFVDLVQYIRKEYPTQKRIILLSYFLILRDIS